MIYYTSDLHFGQKSLLATGKWKERPFTTLEEMHAAQIKKWNDKVTNGDDVYIAGDVGARGYHNMFPELLAQLKGRKHLVLGNHDDVSDLRVRQQFVEIVNYKELTDYSKGEKGKGNEARKVVVSHYPILMWNGQHKGVILLYGRLHNTVDEKLFQQFLKEYNEARTPKASRGETECRAFNVCQCLWGYEPVSFDEILARDNKNIIIR